MITENFVGSGTVTTDALYRWDVNQTLEIRGSGLRVPPVIHFVNKRPERVEEALVVQSTLSGGVIKAAIPNKLLTEPYDIIAYMYSEENNTGTTIEKIRIPVIDRAKPGDYEYTDNITIITFTRVEADIVTYYNRAIDQLNAVDSRLTASVSNETQERIAGDQALKAQIDAIVLNATGDGNAAAEVAQARVDSNGRTYNSLKDRLDAAGIFVGADGGIYQNT